MSKKNDTVYLIWLREGEWGDNALMATRASEEGAKRWCNEHRKLTLSDPIQWHKSQPIFLSDGATPVVTGTSIGSGHERYNYYIESMPLGE